MKHFHSNADIIIQPLLWIASARLCTVKLLRESRGIFVFPEQATVNSKNNFTLKRSILDSGGSLKVRNEWSTCMAGKTVTFMVTWAATWGSTQLRLGGAGAGQPGKRIRELTNWRLSHDDAFELRDRLTAHAYLGTCRLRAKVDAVIDSDSPAS